MPRDLVITWPKGTRLETYLATLEQARRNGHVINYRIAQPPQIDSADPFERVYMVHDGQVRGWNRFVGVEWRAAGVVEQARGGGYWPEGWYIVRDPQWHALPKEKLIPMVGFQGFRYIERERD